MVILFFLVPLLLSGSSAFGVGALLAKASGFTVRGEVFLTALIGLWALMLAALCGREAFAPQVGRWLFRRHDNPGNWRYPAYGLLAVAGIMGAILQFVWRTGEFTLPLGALGVLVGYFSFAPPLAWQQRPGGEMAAALGLGLIPVMAGYYLPSGHLISEILIYGLPLSFAAFNIFLMQGLPNSGVLASGLARRLKPVAVGLVYTVVNILVIIGLLLCIFFPAYPLKTHRWLWVLILLALANQELIKRRGYLHENMIKWIINLTTGLHLGMSVLFAVGLWFRL